MSAQRCLAARPGAAELACGRRAGHDGDHAYYWTGFLSRQDPRLVLGPDEVTG